jgi:hypothetical protein
MTIAQDIEEARSLFERAEREADPLRKARALEDGLALLESSASDEISDAERTLIANLRLAHARRLLSQLVTLHAVQMDVWFSYTKLLFFELKSEVDSLTQSDAQLRENYRQFVRLWRQELLDILGQE